MQDNETRKISQKRRKNEINQINIKRGLEK